MSRLLRSASVALASVVLLGSPAAATERPASPRPTPTPTSTSKTPPTDHSPGSPAPSGSGQPSDLAGMKTRAEQEITQRLGVLNSMQSAIGQDRRLTSTDQALLTGEIAAEITGLTQIRAKIDAETSVKALQSDFQEIYAGYRVYAIERPKADLLRGADLVLWYCANKLDSLPGLISATAGKIALSADATTQVKSLLADAQNHAKTACAEAAGLTPAGYPGNESTLKDATATLKDAAKALGQMRDDYRQMVQILKGQHQGEPTSPRATPGSP
jgi:hypothetical protein